MYSLRKTPRGVGFVLWGPNLRPCGLTRGNVADADRLCHAFSTVSSPPWPGSPCVPGDPRISTSSCLSFPRSSGHIGAGLGLTNVAERVCNVQMAAPPSVNPSPTPATHPSASCPIRRAHLRVPTQVLTSHNVISGPRMVAWMRCSTSLPDHDRRGPGPGRGSTVRLSRCLGYVPLTATQRKPQHGDQDSIIGFGAASVPPRDLTVPGLAPRGAR